MNVLLVDDEPKNLFALSALLEDLGAAIHCAHEFVRKPPAPEQLRSRLMIHMARCRYLTTSGQYDTTVK